MRKNEGFRCSQANSWLVRLLFLSPFASKPLYGGAVVRNHYLAQALASKHEVWACFCGLDGGSEYAGELPLRRPGLPALFDPIFLRRAYRLIKSRDIEAIVSTSLIAGLHGALLKRLTGVRFWMDEHNVEWHCSKRYGHALWPLIYLLEGFILQQADHVTCVSLEDRERLLRHFRLRSERVSVAPNGVDFPKLAETKPSETSRREHKRVLFFGVLDYPPNREAVEILADQIAPRLSPEIEVVIAGKGGEDLAARFPRLTFHGFVDNIHALIADCDAVIVPIMSGGGTRMKILETVACGKPVVSTVCGAEGIERQALGEALTIVESPAHMIDWIESLEARATIELPDQFRELYDWATIWQNKAPL